MGGIRVRWRALAKLAAIAVAALAALQILPGLLRAPEPAPLAHDVGLLRISAPTAQSRPLPRDVISSVPRRHVAAKKGRALAKTVRRPKAPKAGASPPPAGPPQPPDEALAPPPSEPAPSPSIEPSPAPPPPTPAPAPAPADGSEEFAPH